MSVPAIINSRSLLLAVLVLSLSIVDFNAKAGAEPVKKNSAEQLTVAGPEKGDIGGPFVLVDHHGNTVTDADFLGQYLLVYFGYAYCPDVCPTSLILMADAIDQLGENAEDVLPVLITIDPERDTSERLKEYVAHFHPRLVGLTGTLEQIATVTRHYKVYVEKVFEEGWGVEDYFVYHSDAIFFMGPDGKYLDHFGSGTTPKTMTKRMRTAMEK